MVLSVRRLRTGRSCGLLPVQATTAFMPPSLGCDHQSPGFLPTTMGIWSTPTVPVNEVGNSQPALLGERVLLFHQQPVAGPGVLCSRGEAAG